MLCSCHVHLLAPCHLINILHSMVVSTTLMVSATRLNYSLFVLWGSDLLRCIHFIAKQITSTINSSACTYFLFSATKPLNYHKTMVLFLSTSWFFFFLYMQRDVHFEVGILQADPSMPTVQAPIWIPQRAPFSWWLVTPCSSVMWGA